MEILKYCEQSEHVRLSEQSERRSYFGVNGRNRWGHSEWKY